MTPLVATQTQLPSVEGTGRTKLVTVPASALKVHPRAQREIIQKHLDHLIEHMDLDAIGVLQAVDYEIRGKNGPWIIDGQHRFLALQHYDPSDFPVKVLIHLDVKDDARAAALFLRLNTAKPPSSYAKFDMKVLAQDPTAVAVKRIVKAANLDITSTKRDGAIAAVGALEKIYNLDEGAVLQRVLNISIHAWGTRAEAFEGKLMEGLALLLLRHKTLSEETLVAKLAKVLPMNIIGEARGYQKFSKKNVATSVAQVIVGIYNEKRSVNRLADITE